MQESKIEYFLSEILDNNLYNFRKQRGITISTAPSWCDISKKIFRSWKWVNWIITHCRWTLDRLGRSYGVKAAQLLTPLSN